MNLLDSYFYSLLADDIALLFITYCNECSATKVSSYIITPKCEYFTWISPQNTQQTVISWPYLKANNRYYRHNMFVIIQRPKRA